MATDKTAAGFIFVTIGWRQAPKYLYHDSLWDADRALKKLIGVVGLFGGDQQNISLLTWSSSSSLAYPALYQSKQFYDNHVKCIVSLGGSYSYNEMQNLVMGALMESLQDVKHGYPYFYFDRGVLKQKLKWVCG